jgi:hypothetical protein
MLYGQVLPTPEAPLKYRDSGFNDQLNPWSRCRLILEGAPRRLGHNLEELKIGTAAAASQ